MVLFNGRQNIIYAHLFCNEEDVDDLNLCQKLFIRLFLRSTNEDHVTREFPLSVIVPSTDDP